MPTDQQTEQSPRREASSAAHLFTDEVEQRIVSMGPSDRLALIDLAVETLSGRHVPEVGGTQSLLARMAGYATEVNRTGRVVAMLYALGDVLVAAEKVDHKAAIDYLSSTRRTLALVSGAKNEKAK